MGKRILAVAVVVASACTALQYSMTEQESVSVSNNPYQFNGPGLMTFIVSPKGSGDDDTVLSVAGSGCSSQWTVLPSPNVPLPTRVCGSGSGGSGGSATALADDAVTCPHNYSFDVMFAGTQPGTSACSVLITSMPFAGSGTSTETLVLTGIGSGSSGISVSPSEISFGSIQVNQTSMSKTVTVTNNGSASVTVTRTLTGSAFSVSPNGTSFGVGPGSSAFFGVTCTPPGLGSQSGELSFSGGGSDASTKLSCDGIDSPITIAPSSLTFTPTLVGRPAPNETVEIQGEQTAIIQNVSLDSAAIAAGVTIVDAPAPNTQVGFLQTVELAYAANTMHAAGPLGTLNISLSTEQGPRSVPLSGQALLGGVGTNPGIVDLGGVCIGDTGMKDVEVFASEAGDIVLQQVTPPSAPFAATVQDTFPMPLRGNHTGQSATVHVTVTPTAPGELQDVLELTSDVPNMAVTDVQLHAIALPAGVSATPDSVHFGTTAPGTTTSIKEVQLTNCGTSDLMFTGASLAGANASEFTLIGAYPPITLAPTESQIFMVVMQPDTAGYKTAQLVLAHDGTTTIANLDGTADGDVASGKDRETYYACSAGRGAAGWPIALVLFAVVRRRRRARLTPA